MWDALLFLLLLGGYILITYLIVKLIFIWTAYANLYLRIGLLSFLYALFYGIGIAASGGDPGFGFPVPNIVAIALMLNIGFYRGVYTGIYILGCWWAIIFLVMLIKYQLKKSRRTGTDRF